MVHFTAANFFSDRQEPIGDCVVFHQACPMGIIGRRTWYPLLRTGCGFKGFERALQMSRNLRAAAKLSRLARVISYKVRPNIDFVISACYSDACRLFEIT